MKRPPRHLSDEGKNWWKQLYDEYQIQDSAGLLILLTLSEAFDRMRQAQEVILKEGQQVQDRFSQSKPHPLIAVERDCRTAILAGLRALNIDFAGVMNELNYKTRRY
jgi:P27 family predicted phage terminase small subunit